MKAIKVVDSKVSVTVGFANHRTLTVSDHGSGIRQVWTYREGKQMTLRNGKGVLGKNAQQVQSLFARAARLTLRATTQEMTC